jgi:hypothetical protein
LSCDRDHTLQAENLDVPAVLSLQQVSQQRRPRGTLPSLKQQYFRYIQDRIEGYKDSISRDELLNLGNEASADLQQSSGADQFILTEILLTDMVDRLIQKRLRLPSYAKWRKHYLPLREAQRNPVKWQIDANSALASLLPRVEAGDNIVVIGAGAQAASLLLAAHDTELTFLDEDKGVVEQLEAQMIAESLSGLFLAYVATLGDWLPAFQRELDLVVLDAGTLAGLSHANRAALLLDLRNLTRPGGVHVIVPGTGPAAPEAYLSHYPDWDREPEPGARRGKASRSRGVILARPNQ